MAVQPPNDVVDRVAAEVRSRPCAHPLAVAVVAIERLDVVGVALGAAAAGAVVAAAGRRVRDWAPDGSLIREVGDGRHLVVLSGLTAAQAHARCEQLADLLAAPVATAGGEVTRSALIGLATEETDGPSAGVADLVRHAVLALGAAEDGRGRRVRLWDVELACRERLAAQLELGLVEAVRTGSGLLLHFQPEVGLRDGRLLAVEALARWRHPSLGMLGAESFIPVAERSGVMAALGRWALEGAFAQRAGWAAGFPAAGFVVRVNVSPTQLHHDPQLPEFVAGLLARYRLPGSLVGIELTEEVRAVDSAGAVRSLEALRRLGLQIAIDDFGVAHSSPARLDSFPFDTVKIDGRFIHAGEDRPGGSETTRYVVSTVVHLAERLGMTVVAEGIETAADVAEMLELGCVRGQGNGLLPAVDAERMTAVIAAGRVALPRP